MPKERVQVIENIANCDFLPAFFRFEKNQNRRILWVHYCLGWPATRAFQFTLEYHFGGVNFDLINLWSVFDFDVLHCLKHTHTPSLKQGSSRGWRLCQMSGKTVFETIAIQIQTNGCATCSIWWLHWFL